MKLKRRILNALSKFMNTLGFQPMDNKLDVLKKISIESYLENRLNQPEIKNKRKHLCNYEYQVLSQNGEDGIINEIFERIGVTNKVFVEFGVGDGTENNTAFLLLKDWSGIWLEGSNLNVSKIQEGYSDLIAKGRLKLKSTFITAENIVSLFEEMNVPIELDFLSIDIDGNDYWIWKNLKAYRPRVISVEFNGSLGPNIEWIMPYNPTHWWNGRDAGHYFGASLKSFELLGKQLGYKLVGCNISGVNAFFVREDLVGEGLFLEPFTSEQHFQKPLYFLERQLGHRRNHKLVNSAK